MLLRAISVTGIWILGSLLVMAQDGCQPKLYPTFCPRDYDSDHKQDGCEKELREEYFNLLQAMELSRHGPFDYPGSRRAERCPEENDEDKNRGHERTPEMLSEEHQEVNGNAEPLPVEPDKDKKIYLDEDQKYYYQCFADREGPKLAALGQVVGRLELRDDTHHINSAGPDPCSGPNCNESRHSKSTKSIFYAQWGTAIEISTSPYLALTSCHVLEPLVQQDPETQEWYLKLDANEDLMVDFAPRDDQFDYSNEYKVKGKVFWMPPNTDSYKGFDLAVVELVPRDLYMAKKRDEKIKGTRWGPFSEKKPIEVATLGYPDFHHPLDPCADAAFAPYKTQGDAQFVSLGCAFKRSAVSKCGKGSNPDEDKDGSKEKESVIFHTATTTAGESGSILVARDLNEPRIIGVHVCCSYPQQEDYSRPVSGLKCAQLNHTYANQAIDICALYSDDSFRQALKSHGIDITKLLGDWERCKSPKTTK